MVQNTNDKYIRITRFSPAQTTSLQDLNKPLSQIQQHLNNLYKVVTNSKQSLIQWDIIAAADVVQGDLVYFNSDPDSVNYNCFCKAQASISDKAGIQGQSIESASSKVQGIIIASPINGQKALLRQGYYQDAIIKNTLGIDAIPGIYYLSLSKPGKAQKQPGWGLRQPCISYYGDNKFAFISHYLAHDSHHHQTLEIPSATLDATGNYYQYKITEDSAFYNNIGSTTTVFYKGQLDFLNKVSLIAPDTVKWSSALGAFSLGDIVLYMHKPFAYGSPIVRSIESDNLSIDASSGQYKINLHQWQEQNMSGSDPAKAVFDIDGYKLIKKPVVTQLIAGNNIKIVRDSEGKHVISGINSGTEDGTIVEVTDVRLDGTQRVSSGLFTYSTFPANINSSLTASALFQYPVQTTTDITLSLILQKAAGEIDIDFYYITQDITNPSIHKHLTNISLNGDVGALTELKIKLAEKATLYKKGFLIVVLSCDKPTDPINLLKTRFYLNNLTGSVITE